VVKATEQKPIGKFIVPVRNAQALTEWFGELFDLKTADHANAPPDLMLADDSGCSISFAGSADGYFTDH
jgi:hypothetical protein